MTSGPTSQETKRIDAVQTTLDIVEALQTLQGAGVTEIATHVGVTKGTVHNHLATLQANDYVIKDNEDTYQLGFRFLDTAHHARNRIEIYDLITQELDKLAEETGEMVLFTVEEHGKGVCLYRSFGKHAIETPLYVGYRSHLHRTAVGKAILSQLSPERVDEILDQHGLPGVTEHTVTDRAELFDELETIREEGIAYNREETIQGLIGIGMPILNHDKKINAAISVIGPVSRIDEQTLNENILESIRQRSNVIEVNSTSVYNPDL
ncbi:IclR family transcriptional regulator [Natronolimnobius sp. AArcel1]|uniref:IclR family transcriptional regulator n=1 Tax=Natronolimnobius sp. AArcel1 TaxID=1679093 RepID=UPI0013EB9056|nr:IclR family transcriptional regulator [Natronolimnobius sp. AArcel1]NGM70601.1 IclR family transcriptional regulator [Natronolimnobius sp. AArcel1]